MKKRVAYYVSRKNPLIWLAALVMLASAALRIANVCGKGADAKTVWFLVVLPVVGCVFYVLNILCNGSDRFYRSSVPVILLAIYYGIKITLVSPYLWLTFMFWMGKPRFHIAFKNLQSIIHQIPPSCKYSAEICKLFTKTEACAKMQKKIDKSRGYRL